jgi:predicted phage terminase large subunit-like protein
MSSVKEELKAIAQEAYDDPVYFCKTFLPHLFPQEIPWLHRGVLAILTRRTEFLHRYGEVDKIVENFVYERDGKIVPIFHRRDDGSLYMVLGRYTLIMLPRGFAKTTLAGNAVPLYDILYGEQPFAIYVSETATHAQMQMENIKRELESNERIKAVFGALRPGREDSARWAQDAFETTSGMAMAARGRGGQIRGLKHGPHRPRKIIFDDLEDKESCSTEEQRKKTRTWFYGDVLPALPELDRDATVVGLGTLLHQDALLTYLERDPQWTVVKFGVRDRGGNWLWPANINEHKYEVKKKSAVLAGELSTFIMEYDNVYTSDESAKFKADSITYAPAPPRDELQVAVYCDPAISEAKDADFTVIAAVGMSAQGKLYVLDMLAQRGMSPREQVDKYFEFLLRWRPQKAGVESVAYQKALVHLIREEMFRKKYYIELTAVRNSTNKIARINGILQPRYAAGYIVHTRRFPELEAQLLDFPNGKHDDAPDAVAGAIALLDPYAPMAAGEDLGKDSMPPLSEVLGEWRNRRV